MTTVPASVGVLRPMAFRVSCRVCGMGRDLWPDLIPGFLAGHAACQERATTVSINVPQGTDRGVAFKRWHDAVVALGFEPLGEPCWHNPDLSEQMGIDLTVAGNVVRSA